MPFHRPTRLTFRSSSSIASRPAGKGSDRNTREAEYVKQRNLNRSSNVSSQKALSGLIPAEKRLLVKQKMAAEKLEIQYDILLERYLQCLFSSPKFPPLSSVSSMGALQHQNASKSLNCFAHSGSIIRWPAHSTVTIVRQPFDHS